MKVHYIQHVPFEGLGYIQTWLKENDHLISCTKVWDNQPFPSTDDFDMLIIMGGPLGVYDDHQYDWLPDEKNFIFDAIKEKRKSSAFVLEHSLLPAYWVLPYIPINTRKLAGFQSIFSLRFQPG